jgi:2-amino-1-hydroxyethylphosphonate dioxygenase (glycine-forming)
LLAEKQGYNLEYQVAAFLHDIGHLLEPKSDYNSMDDFGIINHEEIAAKWLLAHGFGFKVAEIVKNHVKAKRYLTYKDIEYYNQLSEASKRTLEFQGGIMLEEEAIDFEKNMFFSQIIRIRRWDDAAKLENLKIPNLDYFLEKCEAFLSQKSR